MNGTHPETTPTPTPAPSSILTSPPRTPRRLTRGEVERAKDLRARTSGVAAEILCARAEHLPPPDRDLIWAVFRQGLSLAKLESASGTSTRRLSRRLRAIVDRINSPCFALVISRSHTWEARLAKVARSIYVEGRTLRATELHLRLSYGQVRAARAVIQTLAATYAADQSKEAA